MGALEAQGVAQGEERREERIVAQGVQGAGQAAEEGEEEEPMPVKPPVVREAPVRPVW